MRKKDVIERLESSIRPEDYVDLIEGMLERAFEEEIVIETTDTGVSVNLIHAESDSSIIVNFVSREEFFQMVAYYLADSEESED